MYSGVIFPRPDPSGGNNGTGVKLLSVHWLNAVCEIALRVLAGWQPRDGDRVGHLLGSMLYTARKDKAATGLCHDSYR